jgi:OmpA-OmpF porin, OOP family
MCNISNIFNRLYLIVIIVCTANLSNAQGPLLPEIHRISMIFFDYQSDTVTPEALRIVRQIVNSYNHLSSTVINITGYTDTAEHDQQLSDRRAQNVARALADSGIPKGKMVIVGRGDNNLRVQTPANTQQALNRRVEINIAE